MFKFLCKFFTKTSNLGKCIGETSKFKIYKLVDDLGNIKFTTVDRTTKKIVKTVEKSCQKEAGVWRGFKFFQGQQHITTVTKNGEVVQKNIVTDLSKNNDIAANKSVETIFNPGKKSQIAQLIERRPDSIVVNTSKPHNYNYYSTYNLSDGKITPDIQNLPSRVNVLSHCRMTV